MENTKMKNAKMENIKNYLKLLKIIRNDNDRGPQLLNTIVGSTILNKDTINLKDEKGDTFAHLLYDKKMYDHLINVSKVKEFDIKVQDQQGDSIIHKIAQKTDLLTNWDIKLLEYAEGCLDLKNNKGFNPIQTAILNGNKSAFKILIKFATPQKIIASYEHVLQQEIGGLDKSANYDKTIPAITTSVLNTISKTGSIDKSYSALLNSIILQKGNLINEKVNKKIISSIATDKYYSIFNEYIVKAAEEGRADIIKLIAEYGTDNISLDAKSKVINLFDERKSTQKLPSELIVQFDQAYELNSKYWAALVNEKKSIGELVDAVKKKSSILTEKVNMNNENLLHVIATLTQDHNDKCDKYHKILKQFQNYYSADFRKACMEKNDADAYPFQLTKCIAMQNFLINDPSDIEQEALEYNTETAIANGHSATILKNKYNKKIDDFTNDSSKLSEVLDDQNNQNILHIICNNLAKDSEHNNSILKKLDNHSEGYIKALSSKDKNDKLPSEYSKNWWGKECLISGLELEDLQKFDKAVLNDLFKAVVKDSPSQIETIKQLVQAGADFNVKIEEDGSWEYALHIFAEKSTKPEFKILIKIPGVDFKVINSKDKSPLAIATKDNYIILLKKTNTSDLNLDLLRFVNSQDRLNRDELDLISKKFKNCANDIIKKYLPTENTVIYDTYINLAKIWESDKNTILNKEVRKSLFSRICKNSDSQNVKELICMMLDEPSGLDLDTGLYSVFKNDINLSIKFLEKDANPFKDCSIQVAKSSWDIAVQTATSDKFLKIETILLNTSKVDKNDLTKIKHSLGMLNLFKILVRNSELISKKQLEKFTSIFKESTDNIAVELIQNELEGYIEKTNQSPDKLKQFVNILLPESSSLNEFMNKIIDKIVPQELKKDFNTLLHEAEAELSHSHKALFENINATQNQLLNELEKIKIIQQTPANHKNHLTGALSLSLTTADSSFHTDVTKCLSGCINDDSE